MDEHGAKKWSLIASLLKTKGSKQVRSLPESKARDICCVHCCITPQGCRQGEQGRCACASRYAQCRRRWKNYLNADLKTGGWSPEVRCAKVVLLVRHQESCSVAKQC